jgi:hypothetical protein
MPVRSNAVTKKAGTKKAGTRRTRDQVDTRLIVGCVAALRWAHRRRD